MLRVLARPGPRYYRTRVHHRLASSVLALQRRPRTMSSAAVTVASSSQPSPSTLQTGPLAAGPGAGEGKKQQAKEKKDKVQSAASQYPLEVRPIDDARRQ
jgi:hypothetical protein